MTLNHTGKYLHVLDERGEFLKGRDGDQYSQFGEDGLIEATLERFGETNSWCFEVGASDGVYLSNTRRLIDRGWNAVLIEADEASYSKIPRNDKTTCVLERVAPSSLDRILAESGAPKDMDFGSLDIDGQDYWVWKGMIDYRPRIMLVEFWRPGKGHEDFIPELDGDGQAALAPIIEMGKEKGYVALAKTLVNVLFVTEEVLAEVL